jgi:capsular polysaccharide biosynthesis protein
MSCPTPRVAKSVPLPRWRLAAGRRLESARTLVNGVRFGRPTGVLSMAELKRRRPEWWSVAVAAEEVVRAAPIVHGAQSVEFPDVVSAMPELGVASLPNGYLLGVQGWAFTSRREFLRDASWYGDQATRRQLPPAFGRPRELDGRCLCLASDFAGDNYGHYLLDSLSRLELFKRSGGRLEAVEHVFVPVPPSSSARRTLEKMGVPPSKCIWADRSSWIRAEEVVVTSFPGLRRNYPGWLPASLQQYFAPVPRTATRVYIPRTGLRKPVNEAELIEIARHFGFQVYDFEKCLGEPEFFSSVDAVIGAHGAALANLAYCQPRTRVLELIPSDHLHPYFYTLADSAGLDYHCLAGRSLANRPANSFGPSPFDFRVDPQEFRDALVAMDL